MKRPLAGLLACVLALGATTARAELSGFSHLGQPVRLASDVPADLFAQRTIDREWGVSEDSTYKEVDVPGWKSEGGALVLSGLLPGAGHLYLGESSAWAFLAGEALFWTGHWYEVREARRQWDKVGAFVGNPYDSSATFSFARYQQVTHHDTDALERLWNGDRDAFYRELNGNPLYVDGFTPGYTYQQQGQLHDLIGAHDDASRRQWLFDMALYANHVVAAWDAWRAARAHNAPLREEYHIELGQGWRNGQRELHAALVRRF